MEVQRMGENRKGAVSRPRRAFATPAGYSWRVGCLQSSLPLRRPSSLQTRLSGVVVSCHLLNAYPSPASKKFSLCSHMLGLGSDTSASAMGVTLPRRYNSGARERWDVQTLKRLNFTTHCVY